MARSSEFQRQVDRYFGIPAALLVGLFTRRRQILRNPQKIGLVQPTGVGDLILCSGLIAHIQKTHPDAEIHLFHGPNNQPATALLPDGVNCHCCDFTHPMRTIRYLRGQRLDIVIDLLPWSRTTALICRFGGSRCTIGYRPRAQFKGRLFDIAVDHSWQRHETENLRNLARQFSPMETYAPIVRNAGSAPRMQLPYDRFVLFHVRPGGSRAAAKSWPAEHWIELARRLGEDGYVVGFTGSTGDRPHVEDIIAKIGPTKSPCLPLCGALEWPELAYVLQHACLTITVDTSVLHLASALGCRVIGLHGPTSSRQWGATGAGAIGIDSPHPASGYLHFGPERHRRELEVMRAISPDMVYQAALSALKTQHEPDRDSIPKATGSSAR
jgi:ADP-heptose:LPS heptosyltransferase